MPLALVLFSGAFLQPPAAQRSHRTIRQRASLIQCTAHPHAKLTLVRHGQSEWNLANRFTGWVDVDLTEKGISEARAAGRLLLADGQQHDLVCTSCLRRAIRTACIVLSNMDQCWLPLIKDARLNEQHSGALTGNNKKLLAEKHGVEQVMKWRRTYDCPPPGLDREHPLYRTMQDDRYVSSGVVVPQAESLQMTEARVLRMYEDTLKPALAAGKNVMVVSHGNTLRALVKILDGVSEEDSSSLDLPTACPVVYELDAKLQPLKPHGVWGDSSAVRHGRFLYSEKKVRAAQEAMRQQVVQDIAVSTVRGDGSGALDDEQVSTCDAYTPEGESSRVVNLQGQSFRVRERPPSYFERPKESSEIGAEARRELLTMVKTQQAEGAATAPAAAPAAKQPKAVLILLRHGFSEYNEENRFTGWADVELSSRGREEARFAGQLLREAGVRRLESVYSSYLKRAIKTGWLMLDELELQWVPVKTTWRLNERHYGALQGQRKTDCTERHGVAQVQKWRRGVHDPPPSWDEKTREATVDRRYDEVDVPESESLAQCMERLRPLLDEELFPEIRAAIDREAARGSGGGSPQRQQQRQAAERRQRQSSEPRRWPEAVFSRPRGGRVTLTEVASGEVVDSSDEVQPYVPAFVVASSENLIRALVAELEGLSDEETPLLDIPYATPLLFQLDEDLNVLPTPLATAPLRHGYYLGDKDRIEEEKRKIREQVVCNTGDVASETENPCFVPLTTDQRLADNCFMRTIDGKDKWICE